MPFNFVECSICKRDYWIGRVYSIRNTIDLIFVYITCLLLTADFFSFRTRTFLHPNPLDLPTQQGWIRSTMACGIGGAREGGCGTGCLNTIYHSLPCQSPPHWYDDGSPTSRRGAFLSPFHCIESSIQLSK